ncbi:MAG: hypothetical protein ACD_13C00258G0001 [uncultured bacterium]|nr:MAG: hypothetical protein ACD_13C00258G0001 [uncultured bacterium]
MICLNPCSATKALALTISSPLFPNSSAINSLRITKFPPRTAVTAPKATVLINKSEFPDSFAIFERGIPSKATFGGTLEVSILESDSKISAESAENSEKCLLTVS